MPIVKFRHQNDGLGDEAAARCALKFDCVRSRDRTIQSHRDAADINILVKRFGVTGNFPKPNIEPIYGDFTHADDLHSALQRVHRAQEAFMTLPAKTRGRFNNDPVELLDFLDRPENWEEARSLGLLDDERAAARVVAQAAADRAATGHSAPNPVPVAPVASATEQAKPTASSQ